MSTDRLTEVLNYLSAISREIGQFRSEVNSHFEALEGRFGVLEGRIDQLQAEMRKLNRKFDVLTQDSMDLRAEHRDPEKRTEVLERRAGITDSA